MGLNKFLKKGDILYAGDIRIRRMENGSVNIEAARDVVFIHATESRPGGHENNTKNQKE